MRPTISLQEQPVCISGCADIHSVGPASLNSPIRKGARPLKVKPGDYIVAVEAIASPNCPSGKLTGYVCISSNQCDNTGEIVIPVHGAVVSDIVPEPRAVMLSEQSGEMPDVALELKSVSGKSFDVANANINADTLVETNFAVERRSGGIILTVSFPSYRSHSAPWNGDIVISL